MLQCRAELSNDGAEASFEVLRPRFSLLTGGGAVPVPVSDFRKCIGETRCSLPMSYLILGGAMLVLLTFLVVAPVLMEMVDHPLRGLKS